MFSLDFITITNGTHVCLRQVREDPIWDALALHEVTHLCGAPIVMSLITGSNVSARRKLDHVVEFFTAAAPRLKGC